MTTVRGGKPQAGHSRLPTANANAAAQPNGASPPSLSASTQAGPAAEPSGVSIAPSVFERARPPRREGGTVVPPPQEGLSTGGGKIPALLAAQAFSRGSKVGGTHHVRALVGGDAVKAAIAEVVQAAKDELVVVMHAITSDAFVALLEQRAQQGVHITVVRNDPDEQLGVSQSRRDGERALLDRLRTAGINVVIVPKDQLRLRTPLPMPHDHRKLIIADGKTAYVGGSNPREFVNNFDTGFVLTGPAVGELARSASVDIARYRGDANFELAPSAFNPDAGAIDVLSSSMPGRDAKSAILAAIAGAEARITVANQEIEDSDVIEAIVKRKSEVPGLDVTILVGPRQLHRKLAGYSLRVPMNVQALEAFPKAGINVHSATGREERGGIMHAKVIIVDGTTLIAGSSDLNARSFGGNIELDLRIRDKEVARQMEQGILAEVAQATPVDATTARDRMVSRSVGVLRSAVVSFHRSRRTMTRLGFGFTAAGRRILARQKLGIVGPEPAKTPPASVDQARARLAKALAYNNTAAAPARTLSDTLRPGERLLFVGVPSVKANLLEAGAFQPAVNANFGPGIYLGSDPHTAIDFARVRAGQDGVGTGSVFVVAARLDNVLEMPAGQHALDAWVADQPGSPSAKLMLPHFCQAHGYDAVVVHDAEGPGRDYVLVYDEARLRAVVRQDLGT